MTTKRNFFIGATLVLGVASYAWLNRSVGIEIADARFSFPASALMSSTAGGPADGLDQSSGAFVVLPDGPYHGQWGLLLQSSKDRRGDGMPSGFKEALGSGDLHFSKTSFGWLDCDGRCEQGRWYFQRMPSHTDSTYSVGTVLCSETDICHLFMSYRHVDVQVSLERRRVGEASEVLTQVAGLLGKYEVSRQPR
jgi:hypothetical protein